MIDISSVEFVGFDLDKTLYKENINAQKAIRMTLYNKLAETLRIDSREARKEFIEKYKIFNSGTTAVREMGIKNAEQFSALISDLAGLHKYLKRDPELINLIKYLKEKYQLFLITAGGEKGSILKLKKLGISAQNDFKYAIYGDSEGSGKPTGRSFTEMLKKTKAHPRKHIYIGDRDETDIVPAKKVGIQTIMVWGQSQKADLSLERIYDLKNVL